MEQSQTVTGTNQRWASGIRRLMLGWLTAAALEYLLLPAQAQWLGNLEGLAQMSLIRLIAVTCGVFCVLSLIGKKHDSARAERWGYLCHGGAAGGFSGAPVVYCPVLVGMPVADGHCYGVCLLRLERSAGTGIGAGRPIPGLDVGNWGGSSGGVDILERLDGEPGLHPQHPHL